MPSKVPHRIEDTYISASGWKTPETSHIRIVLTAEFISTSKKIKGSIILLADNGSLLARVRRLELCPIAEEEMHEGSGRKLLHSVQWRPSLLILSSIQLKSVCKAYNIPKSEDKIINYYQKLTKAILWTIEITVAQLSEKDRDSLSPHIQN